MLTVTWRALVFEASSDCQVRVFPRREGWPIPFDALWIGATKRSRTEGETSPRTVRSSSKTVGAPRKADDCGARRVTPPDGESSSLAARRIRAGLIPASEAMASRSARVGPSTRAGREGPWLSSSEARFRSRWTSSSL